MSSFSNYNDSGFKPCSQISNLTKNLQQQQNPNKFIPTVSNSNNNNDNNNNTTTTNNNNNNNQIQSSNGDGTNQINTFHNSYNDQLNFIPSGRNTPTHIGSSYSSSYQNSFNPSHSFDPPTIPNVMATTSMETHDSLNAKNRRIPSSMPQNFQPIEIKNYNHQHHSPHPHPNQHHQHNQHLHQSINDAPNQFMSSSLSHTFPILSMPNHYNQSSQSQSQSNSHSLSHSSFHESSFPLQPPTKFGKSTNFTGFTEPDHYMSYQEFLANLTLKDQQDCIEDNEHLNIVDYPVQDLIVMLSCLLAKIIEANDKLHPNHFDNTIAIRQKLKQERKEKKRNKSIVSTDISNTQPRDIDIECVEVDDNDEDEDLENETDNLNSDDDDDDEMKNKYLANVLAFHGTNVPGISLHAYLARILKYCPVTNEVFLSLLVYFDRIAKKANNFKTNSKKKDDDSVDQPEQLFVMDSYNIHRLIISGITVSSKFFSDIFYKNLRYAKVGGLPLEELNYLELQFLLLLDFKLMISVEDLQNYADLLLRFWKREQLTNEIINSEK